MATTPHTTPNDSKMPIAIPLEHIEDSDNVRLSEPAHQDPAIARKREKRLVLKIDLFILPLLAMVYFFSSMVR